MRKSYIFFHIIITLFWNITQRNESKFIFEINRKIKFCIEHVGISRTNTSWIWQRRRVIRSPRPLVTPPSVTRSLFARSTMSCGDCELTGYPDISSTWSGYVSSGQYQIHYRKKHNYMKNYECCNKLFRHSALLSAYDLFCFIAIFLNWFSALLVNLIVHVSLLRVRALIFGDIGMQEGLYHILVETFNSYDLRLNFKIKQLMFWSWIFCRAIGSVMGIKGIRVDNSSRKITPFLPSISLVNSMPVRPDDVLTYSKTKSWDFLSKGGRKLDSRISSAKLKPALHPPSPVK